MLSRALNCKCRGRSEVEEIYNFKIVREVLISKDVFGCAMMNLKNAKTDGRPYSCTLRPTHINNMKLFIYEYFYFV